MKLYHVIMFQRGKTEGRTLFTAAIAENHNVAIHQVMTADARVKRDKIEYAMVLDSEQMQSHLIEVKKLIEAGKELVKKHSAMLINDTLKTTN